MTNQRSIVVADFPWTYQVYSNKGKGRSAESHYDCMTNQEILDLKDLWNQAFPGDSIACFWATASNMPFAIKVMEHYGYTFKTIAWTWVKLIPKFGDRFRGVAKSTNLVPINDGEIIDSIGGMTFKSLGHYTRSNCEYILLGKKGKSPLQRVRKDIPSVIYAPLGEHSVKPDEANRRIEALLRRPQDPPPVELFARRQYKDFLCTGLELDGMDIRNFLRLVHLERVRDNLYAALKGADNA